jgi:hypothetical protein
MNRTKGFSPKVLGWSCISVLLAVILAGCGNQEKEELTVTLDDGIAKSACKTFSEVEPVFKWESLSSEQLDVIEDQLTFVNSQFQSAAAINNAVIREEKYDRVASVSGFMLKEFLEDKPDDWEGKFRWLGVWQEPEIRKFCKELSE